MCDPFAAATVSGVPDVTNTFKRVDSNRNWSPDTSPTHATNYGSYIYAPLSAIKPSDILGRFNDSNTDGKRIELKRLAAAESRLRPIPTIPEEEEEWLEEEYEVETRIEEIEEVEEIGDRD